CMLLLSVTAMCSIVQFPYAAPIYFCFVAPLVVLAVLAVRSLVPPVGAVSSGAVLAFFLAFAVFRVNTSSIFGMGVRYEPYYDTIPLNLERGGLDVAPGDALVYGRLVHALQLRAHGGYTWASPECPEIYFLSGL